MKKIRSPTGFNQTQKNLLPELDTTGKVHGALPNLKDFGKYKPEDLKTLHGELKRSIKERIRKNIELGRHRPHGQRQAAEHDLMKSIEKYLREL